ncbi:hypothetical protein L3V79_05595 [Thiotrichales bacterium 19S9-12]|nr:hypothetical protein [Thiotrichales bacterium 19S9-11]MCF6811833.1 hypothetical protein [Thiotrichales bacterium 19S9-12]
MTEEVSEAEERCLTDSSIESDNTEENFFEQFEVDFVALTVGKTKIDISNQQLSKKIKLDEFCQIIRHLKLRKQKISINITGNDFGELLNNSDDELIQDTFKLIHESSISLMDDEESLFTKEYAKYQSDPGNYQFIKAISPEQPIYNAESDSSGKTNCCLVM